MTGMCVTAVSSATDDHRFMTRALALAARGLYTAAPNPRVGCVIVRDGEVMGEGYHQRAGEAHAERHALQQAADHIGDGRGVTIYLTLEPCTYHGKTPACCTALIQASPERVVIAMQDPNPRVAGAGIQALQAAGITTEVGLLHESAYALNRGFIKRMTQGLPFVHAKMAMSLDGRTAMANGDSQWISGPAARADGQRLRARSCAIVTGIETVLADDPRLTVRPEQWSDDGKQDQSEMPDPPQQQPRRVILDSQLRIPATARLLTEPSAVLILTLNEALSKNSAAQRLLEAQGAEVVVLPDDGHGRIDLKHVLLLLAERECNEVLLEAGSTLLTAYWQQSLLDLVTLYMAPVCLGSTAQPLLAWPLSQLADAQALTIAALEPIGHDWRIEVIPKQQKEH